MSQILDGIPLHDLAEDHLNSLILLRVTESPRLEYKEELKISTGSEKREFCKDISALANSQGGYVFFGVREGDGIPVSLPGIDYNDTLKEQIYQILTTGISPRIQSIVDVSVPLRSRKHVLVVNIKPDGYLHQVKYEDNRYYKRTGTITITMDSSDVETFFKSTSPSTDKDKVEEFINDYYAALRNQTYFKGTKGKAVCTICIVPEVASYKLDLSNVPDNFALLFQPIYCSGWDSGVTGRSRFTFYEQRNEGVAYAVTEVTELGELRAFNSYLLESRYAREKLPQGCAGYVPSVAYEREIIIATHRYLNSLTELGVTPPLSLHIALINVRGYILWVDAFRVSEPGRPLTQDNVLPEVIHITNETEFKSREDVGKILHPSFDFIWREFGFQRSYNYNSAGDWQPER